MGETQRKQKKKLKRLQKGAETKEKLKRLQKGAETKEKLIRLQSEPPGVEHVFIHEKEL